MTKQLYVAAMVGCLAMLSVGCQEEKTSSLDNSIGMPDAQPKKKGVLESLAFWDNDDKPQPQTVAYEDDNKEGLGDALWPGNWFKSSGPKKITANDVWWDMSPELESVAETHAERTTRHARMLDTNGRQVWDDLDRILLLDRPTHLSLYSVP
ncbi:MAG: hypothetical protein GC162_05225 [Planctomycetes bacterium]|nr:hypothetical protein [Planctomycetota bacterium]